MNIKIMRIHSAPVPILNRGRNLSKNIKHNVAQGACSWSTETCHDSSRETVSNPSRNRIFCAFRHFFPWTYDHCSRTDGQNDKQSFTARGIYEIRENVPFRMLFTNLSTRLVRLSIDMPIAVGTDPPGTINHMMSWSSLPTNKQTKYTIKN